MAILDNKGSIHGPAGDMVFQIQNGQQILRSKPVHYHDRKSEVQLEQRDKMKTVQMLYRKLKPAVKGCFELLKEGQRDCDRFMSLNLLNINTVSDGSLPVLGYRIVGDKMDFNLKYKQINEKRQLKENYTIKDLLDDLELSSQTTVAKQNGELTIEDSTINDGDEIQLVQIIYGG